MFESYPKGSRWSDVSEEHKLVATSIRDRLKVLSAAAVERSSPNVELKRHVSLFNISGHPARDLWCCVYPSLVSNKSYALQAALILSPSGAEFCLCLGAGTGGDPEQLLANKGD